MVEIGRPVTDIEIDSNTSIDKFFEELSQSCEFESVTLSDGLDMLTKMISNEKCWNYTIKK